MGLGSKAVPQKARLRRGSLEVIEIDWPVEWDDANGEVDFMIAEEEEGNAFDGWLQKIESGYGYAVYGIPES